MAAYYFVLHSRFRDPSRLRPYAAEALATLAPYPHEVLVFAESTEVIEGDTPLPRTVVIRFDSREAAVAWYSSPAYRKVLSLRLDSTEGYALRVEGVR